MLLNDEANKFYDRKHDLYEAACLIRCYTPHTLRPFIDTEINYIRHFIKISFINKGIEFIDLRSIFRDNNVISSIPSYFENTESPIMCYKYNKSIRNTILNFNKLVSDLDIVRYICNTNTCNIVTVLTIYHHWMSQVYRYYITYICITCITSYPFNKTGCLMCIVTVLHIFVLQV